MLYSGVPNSWWLAGQHLVGGCEGMWTTFILCHLKGLSKEMGWQKWYQLIGFPRMVKPRDFQLFSPVLPPVRDPYVSMHLIQNLGFEKKNFDCCTLLCYWPCFYTMLKYAFLLTHTRSCLGAIPMAIGTFYHRPACFCFQHLGTCYWDAAMTSDMFF
jgi:hypothetical protein